MLEGCDSREEICNDPETHMKDFWMSKIGQCEEQELVSAVARKNRTKSGGSLTLPEAILVTSGRTIGWTVSLFFASREKAREHPSLLIPPLVQPHLPIVFLDCFGIDPSSVNR
jgi:hypothetical protein